MTTEIVATEAQKAIAILHGGLMDEEKASARDIIIPKILTMQPVSKLVHDEKAKVGELRGSLEANLLGNKDKGAEFIPFHRFKTRVTFKKEKGKQKFLGQIPWTPEHEGTPRLEIIDGVEHEHYETYNVYCLLPDDIKAGMPFPYLISFRSTGYQAGKALETARTKLQMAKKPFAAKVFTLGVNKTENDKGTFYVPTISMGRDTTEEELKAITSWHDMLSKAASVAVDDSDLVGDDSAAADTSTVNLNV